jgi:cytochrome P450
MLAEEAPMARNQLDVASLGSEFTADPYPALNRLREQAPVQRVVYHGLAAWLVTRFADVEAAYRDPRLSADRAANASEQARSVLWVSASDMIGLGESMIFQDPPAHDRLRRLVSKAFTPRRVQNMRPRVHEITGELLDAVAPLGRADILNDFSLPLTGRVVMELVGVPPGDLAEFQRMSSLYLSTDPADREAVPGALIWMRDHIHALVETKQAAPAADLLSDLIAVRDEGDRLTTTELGAMMLILLMAGHETTANLIGNGLLTLLRQPDQMETLRADPSLIPTAVEEMLRYDGAVVAALPRYATEDLIIGGVDVRAGDTVLICVAAANRDPRRFDAPDSFDLRRGDAAHMGFGHGIHYCLGAPLARMEATIALTRLLKRLDDIKLAVPADELTWRITPNVRGLTHLPVTFTATSA